MGKSRKRVYIIAADYNYGPITAKWMQKFVKANGGETVSVDFFPPDVTNFGTTISKIQAAKPDLILSALVGGNRVAFDRQWTSAGMKSQVPIASTTFGLFNEPATLNASESDGIIGAVGYFEELATPASTAYTGVPTPLGGFQIGAYRSSWYTVFLLGMALLMTGLVYAVMRHTRSGLVARAVMQNPGMAATLGVNPARIYRATFALGSTVTGLAGGLLAPVSGITPVMGTAFGAKTFITVVGGGAAIISGTLTASGLFGLVNQMGAYLTTPVHGEIILFLCAILLIRLLPQGIFGRFFKGTL